MGWLRDTPQCRCEGPMVYVTLALDLEVAPEPRYVLWKAGGLQACTPRTNALSIVCCMPKGLFQHGALVRLEVLPVYDAAVRVRSWTHIPTLGKATFRARMVEGVPELVPAENDQ